MAALTATASQVKLRHRARVKTLPGSRRGRGRSNQARGVIRCSAGIIESYELALEASPLLVKSTTSLVGFLVADLVAQGLSSSRREDGDGRGIDLTRSGRNALFGFALYGPFSAGWYDLLDKYVLPEDPTSALAVAAKVAADQVAWAPVLVTTLFAWDLAWNGDNVVGGGLQTKLRADLIDTLKVNWSFWPVFHVLNFRFVPPGDRILYINAVQVLYNVFLCYKASERSDEDEKAASG